MNVISGIPMHIEQKERLARTNDMSDEACARRLLAARRVTGIEVQKDFAAMCGVSGTSYNNMEKARQSPTLKVVQYLYRAHRIDFNFILNGDFSQLPPAVQNALFEQLSALEMLLDQK